MRRLWRWITGVLDAPAAAAAAVQRAAPPRPEQEPAETRPAGETEAPKRAKLPKLTAHQAFVERLGAEQTLSNVEVQGPGIDTDGFHKPVLSLRLRNCALTDWSFHNLQVSAIADVAECRFVNCKLSGVDMRNLRASSAQFEGVDFTDAKLIGADLSNAVLLGTSEEDEDASAATANNVRRVKLHRTNLRGANFSNSLLEGIDAQHAALTEALMGYSKITTSTFAQCAMQAVGFTQAELHDVKFPGSRLIGATFFETTLCNVDFSGADLGSAEFPQSAHLENVVFERDHLKKALIDPAIARAAESYDRDRDLMVVKRYAPHTAGATAEA